HCDTIRSEGFEGWAAMRRREFITVLGGAATWPVVARGQQRDRMRRIGVLTPWASDDAEAQDRGTAFTQGLQQLGWAVGENVRVDYRWGDGKVATTRKYASELVALAPDVIFAPSSAAVAPLLEVTSSVPIVFAGVADPVAAGYVESLARPGSNVTGFTLYEYSIGGEKAALTTGLAPAAA